MENREEGSSNLSHNPRAPIRSRAQPLLMVSPQLTIPLAGHLLAGPGEASWDTLSPVSVLPIYLQAQHQQESRWAPPPACTAHITAHQRGLHSQRGTLGKQSAQPLLLQMDRLRPGKAQLLTPAEPGTQGRMADSHELGAKQAGVPAQPGHVPAL